jgi:hypothetical protein
MTTTIEYRSRRKNDVDFVLRNLNAIQKDLSKMVVRGVAPVKFADGVESYVYGGFVRDLLRDVPFQDMDVYVPCLEIARGFIEFLERSDRLISLETRNVGDSLCPELEYQSFTLVIQTASTPRLKIDLNYSCAKILGENSIANCDMTANNLVMYQNGTISTRVLPSHLGLKNISIHEWNARCIRDCVEGKLVWMVPDRFSQISNPIKQHLLMDKLNQRLQKMLAKNFVETGKHLTNFRLLKRKTIATLPRCDATMCPICHEQYTDSASTAVSKCSHHFHHSCIVKWIDHQEQKDQTPTCPCCRADVSLLFDV